MKLTIKNVCWQNLAYYEINFILIENNKSCRKLKTLLITQLKIDDKKYYNSLYFL